MAKKADLLEEAAKLNLEVTEKNTIAEIEAAIAGADAPAAAVEVAEVEAEEVEDVKTAKAGKRSAKSLAEAEEKAEKEARKEAGDTSPADGSEVQVKKGPKPVTRPHLERRAALRRCWHGRHRCGDGRRDHQCLLRGAPARSPCLP